MTEELFDRSEEYTEMLRKGISLSGEDQVFFIEGRVSDLRLQLPASPQHILDFGCGTGRTTGILSKAYPQARIVGVDTAAEAISKAEADFGSRQITFKTADELKSCEEFDLCYVNGVFHHIDPADRLEVLRQIHRALAPGGHLALFENNPWNPGTRLVMRRIPFDRNAITLSPPEARALVQNGGFTVTQQRFLFYFPRPLAFLRFVEPTLVRLPLGAQYYVLGRKP